MNQNELTFACRRREAFSPAGNARQLMLSVTLIFLATLPRNAFTGDEGERSLETSAPDSVSAHPLPESSPGTHAELYRFEEHPGDIVFSELGPVEAIGKSTLLVWPPKDSAPAPHSESQTDVRVEGGMLLLDAEQGGSVVLPEGLGIYTPDTASIALTLSVTGTSQVQLSWRFRSFPWNGEVQKMDGAIVDIPVTPDGAQHTYDVRVDNMDAWRKNRIVDGLQLCCTEAASVAVARVEVRNRTEFFVNEGMGTRTYAIGGEIRQVMFMHAPARVRYHLRLPERAVFSAGLAAVQSDNSTTADVSLIQGDTREALLREERIGAERWADYRLDLAAFAGEEVEIELAATCETPGQVVLWSGPCIYPSRQGESPPERPNILFYLVDALRADRLDVYGHTQATAPAIAELARNGVRFQQCFSQETCTKPSVMTLHTGIDSHAHGYTCNDGPQFKEELLFFPTFLRDTGYATAAISQNAYGPPVSTAQKSFCRLVELFDINDSVSENTYAAAANFMEQHRDRPFYLYIHTMECHEVWTPRPESCPYTPPPPLDQVWKDPEAAYPPDRYDGSIAFADYNFKRVRDKLEELGLLKNTLIIFTSDHGFALGERGEWAHGLDPYMDQVHVPLIINWPAGGFGQAVITEQVQLADVAPTVLNLFGLPVPGECQGLSLLPLLRGDAASFVNRPIFSCNGWTHRASVTRGDWKLFINDDGGREFYRIAGETTETENVAQAYPDIAAELYQSLKNHIRRNARVAETKQAADESDTERAIDPVKLEILKSLGYIGD